MPDARSAIENLRTGTVDLVILDRMPGTERGVGLLEQIRSSHPEIPVILATGVRPPEDVTVPVLMKPWSAEDLRAIVLETLDKAIGAARDPLLVYTSLTEEQLDRARRVLGKLQNPKGLEEVVVELGYITRAELERVVRLRRSRLGLVELLLEDGHMTEAQAAAYREERERRPDADDFELLVESERIDEEAFLRALAVKHGFPYTEPSPYAVDHRQLGKTTLRYLNRQVALPVRIEDETLQVIVSRPLDHRLRSELERLFGMPIRIHACCGEKILDALKVLDRIRGNGSAEIVSLEYRMAEGAAAAEDAGEEAVQIVDHLLLRAIQVGASDLHVEPRQDGMRVRTRIDGRLRHLTDLPRESMLRVVSRIKVLAGLDIAERRLHQDGKFLVVTARGEVDIRVSSYGSIYGENLVLRLLDRNRGLIPLSGLGFAPRVEALVDEVILPRASGLVLVTGPTGSGKTTSMYSLLQHDLSPDEKVISAEDPVEYVLEGTIQCSVNEKTGPTFADSLRAMVRQDPDTIVVGEIRDPQTASMAFESALTGHKVFSTFHTENSVSAVIRLLEMGIEPFLIASTLSAVVSQRLVRKLCPGCAVPARPLRRQLRFLGLDRRDLEDVETLEGRGCSDCGETGFAGRIGVFEILIPDDDLRAAVLSKSSVSELDRLARRTPHFMSLQEDGLLKVSQGKTTLSELVTNVPPDPASRPLKDLRVVAGVRRQ